MEHAGGMIYLATSLGTKEEAFCAQHMLEPVYQTVSYSITIVVNLNKMLMVLMASGGGLTKLVVWGLLCLLTNHQYDL